MPHQGKSETIKQKRHLDWKKGGLNFTGAKESPLRKHAGKNAVNVEITLTLTTNSFSQLSEKTTSRKKNERSKKTAKSKQRESN